MEEGDVSLAIACASRSKRFLAVASDDFAVGTNSSQALKLSKFHSKAKAEIVEEET